MTSLRRQRLSQTHSSEKESFTRRRNPAFFFFAIALLASVLLLHRVLSNNEKKGEKNSIEKGIRAAVNSTTRSFNLRQNFFGFPDSKPHAYDSEYSRNSTLFMDLKSSRDPQMTVFFSPWCHHCVHFVPEFIKLAAAYEKNYNSSDLSATGRAKGKIIFSTINCVDERETCAQELIEFYPCVSVRHFPKDKKSSTLEGVALKGNIPAIRLYLAANGPDVNISDTRDTNSSKSSGDLDTWLLATRQGASISTGPKEKLKDALASLNFLVAEESLQTFNEAKRETLSNFLTMAVRLLPSDQPLPLSGYRKILGLLEASKPPPDRSLGANNSVASFKSYLNWPFKHVSSRHMHREIKYIVSEINIALTTNDSPLWFVCGQIAPASGFPALSPLDSIQSRRRALQSTVSSSQMLSSNNKVIDLINSMNVTNLPSAVSPTSSDGIPYGGAELGYTCGLWLMLHYFTVAGEHQVQPAVPGIDDRVTTADILGHIRSLVSNLFGCHVCRTHFLESFDSCEFGRCTIAPYDYRALQYWLFELHRGVTLRIYEQQLEDQVSIKAAAGLSAAVRVAMYEIYYPPLNRCPSCHANTSIDNGTNVKIGSKNQGRTGVSGASSDANNSDDNKMSILAYLDASYWHPSWVLEK